MRKQYILPILVWLVAWSGSQAQNYPSLERFGKNRIQYRTFDWKIIRTTNFEIYYYQDGTALANLTAQYAESEFDRITELLGYTPYNRARIFLFNSPQELAQSNIGINAPSTTNAHEMSLSKARIEQAFTGNQVSFRRNLVRNIAELYIYDMLYGGSLKDALQSSLLLSLPDWFMPGLATYIADGNSVALDDFMRDKLRKGTIKRPSLLTGTEAEYVGHSIWNFVVQRYGKDNISNILNLTRIIRNEQRSLASTLGISYSRFLRDWNEYYTAMGARVADTYQTPTDNFQLRIGPLTGLRQLQNLKLSLDKQWIAYSTVFDGKFTVSVVNTANRRQKTVLTGGYRLDGLALHSQTPLLAWQPDNNLIVITEEKGSTYLYRFTDFDKKPKPDVVQPINGLTQVVAADAAADGNTLVLSASKNGQSDLFLYSINRGSYQAITNDLYDDLDPAFIGRSARDIVFSSNRRQDTLDADKGTYKSLQKQFSLFRHDGSARERSVRRLTDSLTTATQPTAANETSILFLSDAAGIRNLYRVNSESGSVAAVTAFPESIRLYDWVNDGLVYSLKDGEEYIGFRTLTPAQTATLQPTPRALALQTANRPKTAPLTGQPADSARQTPTPDTVKVAPKPTIALAPGEVDTDQYTFDEDVLKNVQARARRSAGQEVAPDAATVSALRMRRRENVTVKGPYPYKGFFSVKDAGMMAQEEPASSWRIDPIRGFGYSQSIGLTDLLENHLLQAGIFISTTQLRNTNLFAEYQYLKHRIDFGARIDRQALFVDNSGLFQKYRYNRFGVSASYPFSVNSRVTLSPFYAITRLIDLSTYQNDLVSDYAGARAEYVFDNTKLNSVGQPLGSKMKVRFEEYAGLRSAKESFRRLTIDARHYQRIHRDITLALRFSASQSGGAAPKKSTLGGMENWLNLSGDPTYTKEQVSSNPLLVPNLTMSEIPFDYRTIFFTDFAAPLRGFRQGKLTGNSHMLFNAELRLPLARYLYRGNITSNLLRNLQLVAFTDVGTAWSGLSPFGKENNLNTEVVGGGSIPFRAVVTNFKNPFLIGYGAGIRTMLFGYYVKFDYAWGMEDKTVQKPIAYLTLGYDF